jgi:hypothetical protein
MRTRYFFCWIVVVLLAAAPAQAQQQTVPLSQVASQDQAHLGRYVVKFDKEQNQLVCKPATASEGERLQAAASEQQAGTHLVRSTNDPAELEGLRIILRATDQLMQRPEALLAFRRAAAVWERRIQSDITVVIDVDYGPSRFGGPTFPQGVLGSTFSGTVTLQTGPNSLAGPADVRQKLKAIHSGNSQLQQLYDAIPDQVPSTAASQDGTRQSLGTAVAALPNAQALGFAPADVNPDPSARPFGSVPNIGFNSNFPFDLDPNDGINSSEFDFQAVTVHEIGHALGFNAIIGNAGPPNNFFYTWDLFRVRPDSVQPGAYGAFEETPRVVTPGPPPGTSPTTAPIDTIGGTVYYAPAQTFFTGEAEYETSTATGSGKGGDNQQASHWRDDAVRLPTLNDRYIGIMDPNFGAGQEGGVEFPDIRMLEIIGYEVVTDPDFAGIALSFDGEQFDLSTLPDTLDFGDTDVSTTNQVSFQLQNPDSLGGGTPLYVEAETLIDYSTPEGASLDASLSASTDTVASGETETLTLSYGADQPSVFFGRLRLRTNADSIFVANIPFRLSIGGAVRPTLAVDTGNLGNVGDLDQDATLTRPITVGNEGTLPLDYQVRTALTTRSIPFATAPPAQAAAKAASPFARFYGAEAAIQADTLVDENFADGFGNFSATGDWQRVEQGADTLDGHSRPFTAYFGTVVSPDSLSYRNNATGVLLSSPIDLSSVPEEDLVSLAFNYYLQAETGFDFASVVISYDGGDSFETVATSDAGILVNTENAWRSVVINLEQASGQPEPVQIGFLFESDQGVVDEGWYVDDVQLFTTPGENALYTEPRAGTISDDGSSETVDVTINAGPLQTGFYNGAVQVQANDELNPMATDSLQFTVGSPSFPSLAQTGNFSATVEEDTTLSTTIFTSNTGDADLTYLRVLEPALSAYEPDADASTAEDPFAAAEALRADRPAPSNDERAAQAGELEAPAGASALSGASSKPDGDSLFAAALPNSFATALAQLPDGRMVAVEVGGPQGSGPRAFLLSEDLSQATALSTGLPASYQVLGAAYNDHTGTLWLSVFQTGSLLEYAVTDQGLSSTGRQVQLGFPGVATTYSPELGAFLIVEFRTNLVHAVDLSGATLPGYPVTFSRGAVYQGMTMTGGVLEIGFQDDFNFGTNTYVRYDQFARLFEQAPVVQINSSYLGGAQTVNGQVRSRTRPDSVMYYLTGAGSDKRARVVGVNPPDLPDYTQRTFLEANSPLYGDGVQPDANDSLEVLVDAGGLEPGTYRDTLDFLVNNPQAQLVEFPAEIEVTDKTAIGDEPAAPQRFALHPNYPNPFRQKTTLAFDLPIAARTTVSVYNVLGQRVARLMNDRDLTPGSYTVSLSAGNLASGVYFVRLKAGRHQATRRIVVVR